MRLIRSISLMHTMAVMKLKSQAKALMLGYVWWILEPILYVAVFYLVFKVLLERGGDDFLAFLIVGKIIFLWFQKTASSTAMCLYRNKGVLNQKDISILLFTMVSVNESLYRQIVTIYLMIVFLFFSGYLNGGALWEVIIVMIVTYIFITVFSIFSMIIATLIKDFQILLQMFLMGMMFVSGVFWDINEIPNESLRELLLTYNPLAFLINEYRNILMRDVPINLYGNVRLVVVFGLAGLIFMPVIKRIERKLIKKIFS